MLQSKAVNDREVHMRRLMMLVACVAAGVALHAADVYRPVKEIAIGGEGGGGYLIVGSAPHRAYVSHATKIGGADTGTGKNVGEISDLPRGHGFGLPPQLRAGLTDNRRRNPATD